MTTVQRFDRQPIKVKPKRTPQGFLRVDGNLTRTGVFTYMRVDGTIQRELRLPEEVFAQETLDSFSMLPITDDHPPRFLDENNTKDFGCGWTGENVRRDGDFVANACQISDKSLIGKVERGDSRELSMGYTSELEFTPGVTHSIAGIPDGMRYDAIQRKIRGNHVAVVRRGRAGPEARLRMDAATAWMEDEDEGPGTGEQQTQDSNSQPREKVMPNITYKHDGMEYQDAQIPALVDKLKAEHATALAAAQKRADDATKLVGELQAKHDKLTEAVEKKDSELKAMPERIRGEIIARQQLLAAAVKILGPEVKLDALSEKEIKVAVISKVKPKRDLKNREDSYINVAFDDVVEESQHEDADRQDTHNALAGARGAAEEAATTGGAQREDAESARLKMIEENQNLWKRGSAAAKS